MKRFSFKQKIAAAGAATAIVVGAGVAYASWTADGIGVGSAKAGTSAAITITSAAPTSSLYPTTSSDVSAVLNNSNSYKVHVSSISLDTSKGTLGFAVDTTQGNKDGACNVGSLSFTTQSAGWDVAASGTTPVDLASAISMDNTANDHCQGDFFTVYLKGAALSAS
jgi:hypothetical protein